MEESSSSVLSPTDVRLFTLIIACYNGTKIDTDWEKVATIGGYKDAGSVIACFNKVRRNKFVKLFGTELSTASKVAPAIKGKAAGVKKQHGRPTGSVTKGKGNKAAKAIDHGNNGIPAVNREQLRQTEPKQENAKKVEHESFEESLTVA